MTLHLPWSLTVGGSSKVDKMSFTHPNPISLVVMSCMTQREEMRKNPFWNFWADRLWPFNIQAKIFKFKYLGFYSSNWKTEDSFKKIDTERIHDKKTLFEILSVSPPEILVNLQLPLWLIFGLGPRRNFWNMGFHFFTQIFHFLSNPDRGEILVA